jgi:hypothetical protein
VIALLLAGLLVSPAEAADCTGAACGEILLEMKSACVWVRSRSRDRVTVEARLAQGPPARLAMEPADPQKADAAEAAEKGGPAGTVQGGSRQANLCQRALASEKARNDLRRRGHSLPDRPEIEGAAAECRRAAATKSGTQPAHGYAFDPMFPSSKGTPVYRAPLVRDGACVAGIAEVQGYTATYPDRPNAPAAPARPPLASLCTGDGCGDVTFTPDCLARNTGRRPLRLKVQGFALTLELKSMAPGQSVKLHTFTGCLRPQDITRYEATYLE